jgi:mono/diheme cytochrome c family protein
MKRRIQLLVLFVTSAGLGLAARWETPLLQTVKATQTRPAASQPVSFDREIRPILSDNCFQCHGPDDKQRMAKLRLDTKEGAFAKAGVLVPGDAANSRLFKRLINTNPAAVMPPPQTGHKLTEHQIALIKRWIDEGAQWNAHWAFVAPQRPALPAVKAAAWPRNPIDHFILARLEKEGLKPAPEADRATLLRRVSLDLTGLPPTPAELDAFLADTSAEAFEKVVDRLLASPRYGEKMAMPWLDLARYADTHGYHIDSHRDMWPWRDLLIKSFNQNQRFDQFTIEQLAGDLMPNATLDQKIASGFNRNHMINFEGGAVPEEYQNEYVIDRVETTATTWLGLTMGCARCHSHKYDPLSQKEFYQFYAFFNNVAEQGLDGRVGNARPFLALPTGAQQARQTELTKAIAEHETALSDKNIAPLQQAWEARLLGQLASAPVKGLLAHYDFDGSLSDSSGRYRHGRTAKGDPTFGNGIVSRAVSLDNQTELRFGNVGDFERDKPFTLAVWLRPGLGRSNTLAFQKISDETARRGYELLFEQSRLIDIQRWAAQLRFRLTANAAGDALQVRTRQVFNNGEWRHLAIAYDGSGRAAGVRIYLDGQPQELEILQDTLQGSPRNEADLMIGTKIAGKGYGGGIDDLRLYERALSAAEIEQLGVHYPIQTILSGVSGKRTKEESDRLREYFLTRIAPAATQQQYAALKELKKQKTEFDKTIVNTMTMMELGKPRESFVLARGDYRNKTDKVTPAVPAVLPPLPAGVEANRLALAKWLVDPQHPLTARVAVNRYWQMYFGFGLVKTVEDFGSQGEPPVNQELLDWLATEFIRTGWDVKAMQRLIVTSAAYRQLSKVTPELHEKDPENRLLARGPRFRLPAELVRDNALAVSGLLNATIGGPSVLPYQPPGLWEEMAFGDGFSRQTYVQDHGADLYRRTMYTFWKRTVPPAALSTFDAPDREKCVARRAVTNTPLQALVTLNDPTYVEAARALAERALREGGKDLSSRIAFAFRLATARKPAVQELKVLRELLTQQLAVYRGNPQAAAKLLRVGESKFDEKLNPAELAAWTMLASTILNLDETITKE